MPGTPVKVFLMRSEIGYTSRELANKLFKNLTANPEIRKYQVFDDEGKPVVLEGIRTAWITDEKGKMREESVPTLREVWREETIGIKLSPFVAGSVSRKRSEMLTERQALADLFDVESSEIPVKQFTKAVALDWKKVGRDMNAIINSMGGATVISSLAESIHIASTKDTSLMEKTVGELVKKGDFEVIPDAEIETTGMNLDEVYGTLNARDKQFLYDTLISRQSGWADNRTDEEKELAREKEERYQDDLRALKAKYAPGFYHGE